MSVRFKRSKKLYDINEEENKLVIYNKTPEQGKNVLYIKEKRYREYFVRLGLHIGLILFLFLVTYLNKDINGAYRYQNELKNMFLMKNNKYNNLNEMVAKPNDIWIWLTNNFYPTLYDKKFNITNLLNDCNSYIIDFPIIKQSRVKTDSCINLNIIKIKNINACYFDYSTNNEETNNFGISWSELNSSSICQTSSYSNNVCNSFRYQTPKGQKYSGLYSDYNAGGYIYEFNMTDKTLILNDIQQLESLNWINKNTRSICLEFTTYNPNINSYSYNSILFEFLPTGNIIKSAKFNPISLLAKDDSYTILILALNILILVFVIFNMIIDIFIMFKIGFKEYFSMISNYVGWLVYIFSIISLIIFVFKLFDTYNLLDHFKYNPRLNHTIFLQKIIYWNDLLGITLGLSILFSMVKCLAFFNINQFNRFLKTFDLSFKQLAYFTAIFIIVFLAFSQLFYLTFMAKFKKFSNLIDSMQSCFLMTLKSSHLKSTHQFDALAILLFIIFNLLTILMLYYLLSSILLKSLVESNEKKSNLEDKYVVDLHLIWLKIKYRAYKLFGLNTEKFYFYFSNDYNDISVTFKVKTLKLLDRLNVLANEELRQLNI